MSNSNLRNELSQEAGTAYINRLRGEAKIARFNADGSPLEGAAPAGEKKPWSPIPSIDADPPAFPGGCLGA